jgi:hypothetical protein
MAEETPIAIITGATMLAEAMASLPMYVKDCHSIHDDMVEFEAWAKIFLDPASAKVTIKANAKAHLATLTFDLAKVKRELGKDEYFQAGVDLGNMVVILTTPPDVTYMHITDERIL